MGMIPEIVKDLGRAVKHGKAERYIEDLREQVHGRKVKFTARDLAELSVRELFEQTVFDPDGKPVGHEYLRAAGQKGKGLGTVLLEAADAVSTTHFSDILGQFTYAQVLDVFERAGLIGDMLMNTVPAGSIHEEIIPGVGRLGDEAEAVGEAEEYPRVGPGKESITVPKKTKDGFIVPITAELIWEDKTGLVLQRAGEATEALAITLEKEKLDTALGITTSYRRNKGAAQATYADSHTNGDFDNLAATNALVDYTDIENALLLFDAMTDPNTGEPITVGGNLQLVVPTALSMTASNILNTTNLKIGADSAAVQMQVNNPLSVAGRTIDVITSPYVKARTSSATTWFIGDFKRAFAYYEVWPVRLDRRDGNTDAAFYRDIVTEVKVSRMGAPAVVRPWFVVKCTG